MDELTPLPTGPAGDAGSERAGGDSLPRPARSLVVQPKVRTVELQLDGDYDGITVTLRTNPTLAQRRVLQAGEEGPFLSTLVDLIQAWNVGGADGQLLPLTLESLETLPDDLISAIVTGWTDEVKRPLAEKSGSSPT